MDIKVFGTDRRLDRPAGRLSSTHRHDEADIRFLQFGALANNHLHSADDDGASRSFFKRLPRYFTSVNKSRVYRRRYIQ